MSEEKPGEVLGGIIALYADLMAGNEADELAVKQNLLLQEMCT